jgi:serine/threonine protein kinase
MVTASFLAHCATQPYNRNAMNRYDIGQKLGEGSFGTVFYAKKKRTGEEVRLSIARSNVRLFAVVVLTRDSSQTPFYGFVLLFQRAIKCIRGESSWEELCQMRELKSILCIPPHPNVVQLYEVHREHDGLIRFVFEYMPSGSLLDLIEDRSDKQLGSPSDFEVRNLVYQTLKGVQHLHRHGIFHRDIKPENILLAGSVCKVADFSLARERKEEGPPTSYISTRWYRAPEILLASKMYSSAVDIWAIGCIVAELYKLDPLFPGCDEIDQLRLIFHAMGTPKMVGWEDGTALLQALQVRDLQDLFNTSSNSRTFLERALNVTDVILVDFLLTLLKLNPVVRSDATEALSHSFFNGIGTPPCKKSKMRSDRRKPLKDISECCSPLSDASNAQMSAPAMAYAAASKISPQHLKDSRCRSIADCETKQKLEDVCHLYADGPTLTTALKDKQDKHRIHQEIVKKGSCYDS